MYAYISSIPPPPSPQPMWLQVATGNGIIRLSGNYKGFYINDIRVIMPGCNDKPQKINIAMSLDEGSFLCRQICLMSYKTGLSV